MERIRVLLIDDDILCLRFLRSFFRRNYPDFEVDGALEGFMAGWKAKSLRPHLIFLDIRLPHYDGYHIYRFLKHIPGMARTRVIAMSGDPSSETVKGMLRLGAQDFLAKPISNEVLKATMQKHLASINNEFGNFQNAS